MPESISLMGKLKRRRASRLRTWIPSFLVLEIAFLVLRGSRLQETKSSCFCSMNLTIFLIWEVG